MKKYSWQGDVNIEIMNISWMPVKVGFQYLFMYCGTLCKFVHDPCKCVVLCLSTCAKSLFKRDSRPYELLNSATTISFVNILVNWYFETPYTVNKYFNSSKYFFLYHSQNVTLGHLAVIFSTFIKFYANKIGSDSI